MSVFDLSKYQPENRIDDLIAAGNCDGVILKLAEPTEDKDIIMDPKFITHVNKAAEYGLPYGIYFMSRAENADEFLNEAQYINDQIYTYLNSQMPNLGVWLDLERKEVIRPDVWQDVLPAIQTMQSWWSTKHVGIYASRYYFTDYLDVDQMIENQIPAWVADYHSDTNILQEQYPQLNVVLWQFTTNGNTQDESYWYGFQC